MIRALVLALAALPVLHAQVPPRRVAFLVGVNEYQKRGFDNLACPENDVDQLAAALRGLKFDAVEVLKGSGTGDASATRNIIEARLLAFLKANVATKDTVVLVALNGHGVQMDVKNAAGEVIKAGEGFFCPSDVVDGDPATMLSLSYLIDDVLGKRGGRNLVLIDACRNDPNPNRGRGIEGRKIALPENTAVLFSCGVGQRAFENDKIGMGLFSWCVLDGLKGNAAKGEELTWLDLANHVSKRMASNEVKKYIPGGTRQMPVLANNIDHTVLANVDAPAAPVVPKVPVVEDPPRVEPGRVISKDDRKTIQLTEAVAVTFVRVPRGKFTMGSPNDEADRGDDEAQREVVISHDYYLGIHEVTQAQYEALMGGNPSKSKHSTQPVESVTWAEAVKYCDALNEKFKVPGYKFALPTEAQWEYACRAGETGANTKPYHLKSGATADASEVDLAAYIGQDKDHPSPVGTHEANRFGLFDMHGNVMEWCADVYDPKAADGRVVVRGGAWRLTAAYARAADRKAIAPDQRSERRGFRVALVPAEAGPKVGP